LKDDIFKPDPHSFLFSVNEGSKYPITQGDRDAINCDSQCCAVFGKGSCDLVILSDSNNNTESYCYANSPSFNLPPAKGEGCEMSSSSINGGKKKFTTKEFEVFKVFVRIILIYLNI
jgi:hypothetical protein